MRICICGGGSLGHVCAGVFSSLPGVELSILSGHPDAWGRSVTVNDPNGGQYLGTLSRVSDKPEDVACDQDVILFCLPGYLIENKLKEIKPFIGNAVLGSVVSSTGFFFFAHEILGEKAKLFGFQRVPYIARVAEYGKSANLLGYKTSLSAALENIEDRESFRRELEFLFKTPVSLLDSFYEASLSNSNPILHTGRLYSMFNGRENELFDRNILFYKEWTDDSSRMLIEMDSEFFRLLDALGTHSLPTLLDYYESTDAPSLTRKLSSIPAFQSIYSPMKQVEGGWRIDFASRYFTEDFPFGLRWIKELAAKNGIVTPVIDEVYNWGMRMQPCI